MVRTKAGLHVRRKHKHKQKPRVNRDEASTSARSFSCDCALRRPGSHVAYACACAVRVNQPLLYSRWSSCPRGQPHNFRPSHLTFHVLQIFWTSWTGQPIRAMTFTNMRVEAGLPATRCKTMEAALLALTSLLRRTCWRSIRHWLPLKGKTRLVIHITHFHPMPPIQCNLTSWTLNHPWNCITVASKVVYLLERF